MHKAAELIEIGLHSVRVDQQIFHHAGEPVQGEIKANCRIRAKYTLNGGVRDVTLVPERHIFQRRRDGGAHDPRNASQIFGQDGVALVRHCRRAFLPHRKKFLRLTDLGALHVADFGRQTLDRAGDNTKRGKEHRVPVTGNDLC